MRKQSNKQNQHGQSMIEMALLLPIWVVLFIGMVEVIFICRTYLVILDSSYQGAHLGSQGLALYDNDEIYTLVTQDLSHGYDNSSLIDVIITRADVVGGTTLQNYTQVNMKGSGRASILTQEILTSRLRGGDPAGRLIAIEVVYDHQLLFNFPIVRNLFPNPFPLVAYTIQYVAR
jgi:hypothetical protein